MPTFVAPGIAAMHPTGQHMNRLSAVLGTRRVAYIAPLAGAVFSVAPVLAGAAHAQTLGYAPAQGAFMVQDEDGTVAPTPSQQNALPERLRRTVVDFETGEGAGTIIIDTGHTMLYYVLGHGRAIRYAVGVGREGFTWSGVQAISRKAEWPDWQPPAEMIARQPYLPRFVAGGPGNPLGARALYLGTSEYRIHGTNDPTTIGKFVSSGCIRMSNEDVIDLFNRVNVGTKVVVLPKSAPLMAKGGDPVGRAVSKRPARATTPSGRPAMTSAVSVD